MSESFLYYIWQYQYFNKHALVTADGDPLNIFNTGYRNSHAGPDFSNARIKINEIAWVGNVEIHVNASDWISHSHHGDKAYENVILHVVWKNDKQIKRMDGTSIPTLELKDRIDNSLLIDYKKLVNSAADIPCGASLPMASPLLQISMLDKVLTSRLETKANEVLHSLKHNNHDWNETLFQALAKNFGFKVNAEPFSQLALSLSYKILLKHADKLLQVEAMLLGQAGFLEAPTSDDLYYKTLQREYRLLSQKYNLQERQLHSSQWKFLRLRPANFPTLRLAQLASVIAIQKNLFSKIIEAETPHALIQIFSVKQSLYWQNHYHFGSTSTQGVAGLGEQSIDNIIINTVVPVMVAYGKMKDDSSFVDRAINILQNLQAEQNHITKKWIKLELRCKNAFDSQAFIELFNSFCSKRRCLDCNIGASFLKPASK